ncbi:hypothetical protein H257_07715 [Aphanomyces astaci]|uniref:Uncharacterized protein n=1 Tax=Aphanomyces astaci TaxID=112090 RepID=W4GGV8_APHAT|nr:hypothetical protein H257_07715 [Aphanomyces astaci]ETV78925.1 hypothetical protein H257_07715 [Aphanomyces astaci]|eukprot:XP_009831644.1 hypothetical protein H257_07715 [Aphanomyces astaci]
MAAPTSRLSPLANKSSSTSRRYPPMHSHPYDWNVLQRQATQCLARPLYRPPRCQSNQLQTRSARLMADPSNILRELKRYLPPLSTPDEATANDPLDPAAALLPLPPPSTSPPPKEPQASPPATLAPPLAVAPQPPAPDNLRLLAAPPLSIYHPAPAADSVACICASSRAHVEELAVGEAHMLDQALVGSTEIPLGDNRAPCTCTCAAADIAACPLGGERPDIPDCPRDRDRGIAMDSDGFAGGDPRDRLSVETPMLLSMPPTALSDKRLHKRCKVLKHCFIIAKLDPPHVHSPALQAPPFMQLTHGTLELIKPVKTHPRQLHTFHGKQHPQHLQLKRLDAYKQAQRVTSRTYPKSTPPHTAGVKIRERSQWNANSRSNASSRARPVRSGPPNSAFALDSVFTEAPLPLAFPCFPPTPAALLDCIVSRCHRFGLFGALCLRLHHFSCSCPLGGLLTYQVLLKQLLHTFVAHCLMALFTKSAAACYSSYSRFTAAFASSLGATPSSSSDSAMTSTIYTCCSAASVSSTLSSTSSAILAFVCHLQS